MPDYKDILLYDGEIHIKFDEINHAYYLLEDGKMKRLPGVTTIIGDVMAKPALVPWAVGVTIKYIREHLDMIALEPNQLLSLAREESKLQKDLAAEIGNAIHDWISKHIDGHEPEMPDDPKVLQGVNSFLDWVIDNKVKFIWSERVVYSKKFGYVGTADILAEVRGEIRLIDIKTGNAIYPEHKMQTAAYTMALREEDKKTKIAGRSIIRISKETEEEYTARMQEKKLKKGFAPYQVFEEVILDNIPADITADYLAFGSCLQLYRWQKEARKVFKT